MDVRNHLKLGLRTFGPRFLTPGPQALCCDLFMIGERFVRKSCQRKGTAMSDDDMKAELERLRSENAALKKGAVKTPEHVR
jgi:hypothetical protein